MNEKGKFGYIFVIWMLVFIIVILFFLYFSGFLYSANPNQVSNLPLGTTSKISLKEETVALATHVIVNEEYGFSKKEKYIVNILVESISSTLNIEDMWGFNLNLE